MGTLPILTAPEAGTGSEIAGTVPTLTAPEAGTGPGFRIFICLPGLTNVTKL